MNGPGTQLTGSRVEPGMTAYVIPANAGPATQLTWSRVEPGMTAYVIPADAGIPAAGLATQLRGSRVEPGMTVRGPRARDDGGEACVGLGDVALGWKIRTTNSRLAGTGYTLERALES